MEENPAPSKPEVDWSTYDRVTHIHLLLGVERKPTPFKGIIIGQRQFMGIMDYIGYPFIVFALVSGYPLYGYKTIQAIQPTWLATVLFYWLMAFGVALALCLFVYLHKARMVNDETGTGAVYLNLETREVAIRDYQNQGTIIPLDSITKLRIFRIFSLELGPISIKLYARLIIHYVQDGKKHVAIAHFMDDAETTAHTLSQIIHEEKM